MALAIIHAVDPASPDADPFSWLYILSGGLGLIAAYIGMSVYPYRRSIPAVFTIICGVGCGLLAVLLLQLEY